MDEEHGPAVPVDGTADEPGPGEIFPDGEPEPGEIWCSIHGYARSVDDLGRQSVFAPGTRLPFVDRATGKVREVDVSGQPCSGGSCSACYEEHQRKLVVDCPDHGSQPITEGVAGCPVCATGHQIRRPVAAALAPLPEAGPEPVAGLPGDGMVAVDGLPAAPQVPGSAPQRGGADGDGGEGPGPWPLVTGTGEGIGDAEGRGADHLSPGSLRAGPARLSEVSALRREGASGARLPRPPLARGPVAQGAGAGEPDRPTPRPDEAQADREAAAETEGGE